VNQIAVIKDDAASFELIMKQSEVIAKSSIVPSAYRGKPADIIAAGLAGRAFGWDVMTAMRNYHVIEGSASMRPEAMLGLVRQAGHSVTINSSPTAVTAEGKRADNGDQYSATFSMEDAANAGLANKRNWKQYPDAMLTWRAVSKLCRYLFPDVVLGAGLVPEELGADVDEVGELVDIDAIPAVEPFELPTETGLTVIGAKQELLDACNGDKELAKEMWGDRGSDPVSPEELAKLIEGAKAILVIDAFDAEEVDDDDAF
tara:strand:+ start:1238 stop:2014 length:777 start_codon:yes stop_codon:yes gene_type:complete